MNTIFILILLMQAMPNNNDNNGALPSEGSAEDDETRPCSDCKQYKTHKAYFARQWKRSPARRTCFVCAKKALHDKRRQKEALRKNAAATSRQFRPQNSQLTAADPWASGARKAALVSAVAAVASVTEATDPAETSAYTDLTPVLLLLEMIVPRAQ
jgi:hypothetical protein